MTTPKRHHTIPRFLLERFAADGMLTVYDRTRDVYWRQSPKNTSVISDYYTVLAEDGTKDTRVEAELSRIESLAAEVLAKADRRESLTEKDKAALAFFIALQRNRLPEAERNLNAIAYAIGRRINDMAFGDPERARTTLTRMQQDTGMPSDIDAAKLAEFVQSGGYSIEMTPTGRLSMMVQVAADLVPVLMSLDWFFVHTTQRQALLITDDPFVVVPASRPRHPFYGVGILTPGSQKYMPLGSHLGLLMTEQGDSVLHGNATGELTRVLNLLQTRHAADYVYGRDERLVRALVTRSGIDKTPRAAKMTIG